MLSRFDEMQTSSVSASSLTTLLPKITRLMRNDFSLLMQCLEQSNDVLSKVYSVEVALTLAHLDALMKEEERRFFVCSFDALIGRLIKDLHHFVEKEGLLQQDVCFIKGLVERCREMEVMYNCRKGRTASAVDETRDLHSAVQQTSLVFAPFLADGVQAKEESSDVVHGCTVKSFLPDLHQAAHSDMTAPAACNVNDALESTKSAQLLSFVEGSKHLGFFARGQNIWLSEEFWEFICGKRSNDDLVAILGVLQLICGHKASGQNAFDIHENVISTKRATEVIHTCCYNKTKGSGCVGTTDVFFRDGQITRSALPNTEDKDSFKPKDPEKKKENEEEEGSVSANVVASCCACLRNKTVACLGVLVEGLLCSELRVDSTTKTAAEPQQTIPVEAGNREEMFRRHSAPPSQAALDLLRMFCPALCSYTGCFAGLAKIIGDIDSGEHCGVSDPDCGGSGNFNFQQTKSTNSNGGGVLNDDSAHKPAVDPADLLLFCLFKSFSFLKCDAFGTTTVTAETAQICKVDRQTTQAAASCAEDNVPVVQRKPREGASQVSLLQRIATELECILDHLQVAVTSVRVMQEQVREEATLLCFRVVSTILYSLLPAVQSVDRRSVIFYRKWVCDIYRLLWEENLLDRFSRILSASTSSATKEDTALASSPFRRAQSMAQRRGGGGGKCLAGKGTSLTSSATSTTPTKTTNRSAFQKESGGVAFESFNEKLVDATERIAPGNAYSCALRTLSGGNVELAPTLMTTDVNHPGFTSLDDPAVLLAGFLFEKLTVCANPPPGDFLVTRLMAALLCHGDANRLTNFAASSSFFPEHFSQGGAANTTQQQEQHPPTTRKTTFGLRSVKHAVRKKGLLLPQNLSVGMRAATPSHNLKLQTAQQQQQQHHHHHHDTRFPVVTCAEDVKALYCSALFDAEVALSPHNPIRAALVQNTVDYLVSGMRGLGEAYELLDAYLDDVSMEPIQLPATTHGVLDDAAEGTSLSFWNSSVLAASRRRAMRARCNNAVVVGEKACDFHVADTTPVKQSASSHIVPSWSTQEENEQFLVILALLRREHINLRTELGLVPFVIEKEKYSVSST